MQAGFNFVIHSIIKHMSNKDAAEMQRDENKVSEVIVGTPITAVIFSHNIPKAI